jgi:hypothetical protein
MTEQLLVERVHDPRQVIAWSIDDDIVQRLIEEAAGSKFIRTVGTKFGARLSPCRITSPFDMASTPGSSVAREVATSPGALEALRGLTSSEVVLSAATYILYNEGSFIGVHNDRDKCELNLLMLLVGEPTVFEFLPSLVDAPAEVLFDKAKAGNGFIDGGETVPLLTRGSAVAFVGSLLPHQRRPVSAGSVLNLSLCYHFSDQT